MHFICSNAIKSAGSTNTQQTATPATEKGKKEDKSKKN
jgi:hypothetical protein